MTLSVWNPPGTPNSFLALRTGEDEKFVHVLTHFSKTEARKNPICGPFSSSKIFFSALKLFGTGGSDLPSFQGGPNEGVVWTTPSPCPFHTLGGSETPPAARNGLQFAKVLRITKIELA